MKVTKFLIVSTLIFPGFAIAGPISALVSKEGIIAELAKAKKMNLAEEAGKIASGAKKAGKLPYEDLIIIPKFKLDAEVAKSSEFVATFQRTLADSIHADWQKTALASGKTERFKVLKVDGKAIKSQKELDQYFASNNIPANLKKYFKINNGQVEEDILHIPNRFLGPNNKAENDASAKVVAVLLSEYTKRGGKTDPESLRIFMQKSSDIVHQQWMLRNSSWAPESQMQPFAKLTPEEAQKDIDMVVLGFSDYSKAQEEFLTAEIKRNEAQVLIFKKKNANDKAQAGERNIANLKDKLNALKTQNRMLQYKPAAPSSVAPASGSR